MKQFIWSPGYANDLLVEAETEEEAIRLCIQDRIDAGCEPCEAHVRFVEDDLFIEVPTKKASNRVPYAGELNWDNPWETPNE